MQLSPDLRIGGPFYRQTVPEESFPVCGAGKSLPGPSGYGESGGLPEAKGGGWIPFSAASAYFLVLSEGRRMFPAAEGKPALSALRKRRRISGVKPPYAFCENKKPRNEDVPRFFRLIFQNWEWVYFSSGAFFISSVSGTSEVPTAEKRTESESL